MVSLNKEEDAKEDDAEDLSSLLVMARSPALYSHYRNEQARRRSTAQITKILSPLPDWERSAQSR